MGAPLGSEAYIEEFLENKILMPFQAKLLKITTKLPRVQDAFHILRLSTFRTVEHLHRLLPPSSAMHRFTDACDSAVLSACSESSPGILYCT